MNDELLKLADDRAALSADLEKVQTELDQAELRIKELESRLAAQSPEPVAWQWLFGGVWHTICKHDVPDLERYARSQSEVVRPIYTAPPQPASDGALREALERLKQGIRDIAQACVDGRVCDDVAWFTEIPAETLFDKCCNLLGEDLPTRQSAPAASEATKSDGGVEGHAKCDSPIRSAPAKHPQVAESLNEQGHDADIAGIKPGPSDLDSRLERLQVEASDLGYVLTREPEHPDSPHASDTRPADVTVDELAQLIIKTVETSAEGCSNGVWVNAHPAARALLDTYKIGAK
ncbi:hypothetical protein [Afipia carboxidovorans]|uniref:hypothetical protein n=1 Tax=Afipia carboxidovorans TaxID=40137 RepID=UPI003091759A|nr:hypothetical protein CRBSH125_05600 [Afipia carboxidovorans]